MSAPSCHLRPLGNQLHGAQTDKDVPEPTLSGSSDRIHPPGAEGRPLMRFTNGSAGPPTATQQGPVRRLRLSSYVPTITLPHWFLDYAQTLLRPAFKETEGMNEWMDGLRPRTTEQGDGSVP